MKQLTNRRTVLIAAGAAAVAATSGRSAAQASDISGTVTFKSGAPIPKGRLKVYLADPAAQDKAQLRASQTLMDSNGKSKVMDFSLAMPANFATSATMQIIGRLEREDGWLLARGSARLDEDSPTQIALREVVY
jgi:hypothetical protein